MTDRPEPRPVSENLLATLQAEDQRREDDRARRDERDTERGHQRAEPEPEEPPEPRRQFRHEREAHEALRQDAREAADLKRRISERKEREAADGDHDNVHRAASWSDNDRALYGEYQQRVAQFNASAAQFTELSKLAESNPGAVSPTLRQGLASAAQQLQQEKALLSHGPRVIQQRQQQKVAETGKAILEKTQPELKNVDNQKRLVSWLKSKGFSEEAIASETNPNTVSMLYKKMVEEQKAEADQQQRQERQAKSAAYAQRYMRRGTLATPTNAQQGRERLRKTGTLEDALSTMRMRAIERGER